MNKPKLHRNGQSGQAIVLIALVMVVLLASLGLAIDGGGMFLLYRDTQNAVDSAALASAFALCTGGDPEEAGLRSLELNGLYAGRIGVTVDVNYPPEVHPDYINDDTKVEIIANVVKPSYFIQVVYQGPLTIDVTAISQCDKSVEGSTVPVDEQYAFRSVESPGSCTSNEAMNFAGTNLVIQGDVWMPTITAGKDAYNTNDGAGQHTNGVHNPPLDDNNIDVLGNIFVAGSQTQATFESTTSGVTTYYLVEDLPETVGGSLVPNVIPNYGGDGTITFGAAAGEPDPLPYDMDYFRPPSECEYPSSSTCGVIYNRYYNSDPALNRYYDLNGNDQPPYSGSDAQNDPANFANLCKNSGVTSQDFTDDRTYVGQLYDNVATGSDWRPGFYYTSCDVEFNNAAGMEGDVNWISEGKFLFNSENYDFEPYNEDEPLFVSDHGTGSSTNCSMPSNTANAYSFNADNSHFRGVIVAFQGGVEIGGQGYFFETCFNVRGLYVNGNSNSLYQCVSGSRSDASPGNFGIVE